MVPVKNPSKVQRNVRLPERLMNQTKKRAASLDLTVNEYICLAIGAFNTKMRLDGRTEPEGSKDWKVRINLVGDHPFDQFGNILPTEEQEDGFVVFDHGGNVLSEFVYD